MGLNESNGNMVMPVGPMYGSGYGNGNGWNNSDWMWILFLFAFMGNWGNNGNGFGGGNGSAGSMLPYFTAQNTDSAIQRGFDQSAVTGQLAGIQTSLTNGFASAEVANCNRTINSLERSFDSQTAVTSGLSDIASQLAQCCCENRLATCQTQNTIVSEASANRYADAQNTRDIIENANRNSQAILDKLCQLELDGVKAQLEAKNETIAQLRDEALYAKGEASRLANADQIVDNIYNRLNNCPVGTTPVYGRTPIFTCNNNNCGCGSF